MGLSRKVYDYVDSSNLTLNQFGICNVAVDKAESRTVPDRQEVVRVSGVGELVKDGDLDISTGRQQISDEGGANESGPAGH